MAASVSHAMPSTAASTLRARRSARGFSFIIVGLEEWPGGRRRTKPRRRMRSGVYAGSPAQSAQRLEADRRRSGTPSSWHDHPNQPSGPHVSPDMPIVALRHSRLHRLPIAFAAVLLSLISATRSLAAQSAPASSTATPPLDSAIVAARVDSVFAPWRGTDHPGCVVGVSQRGRVLLERAYGMAEVESGVAMSPSTVVHAASLAKQVTALSVLLLARDGKLSLDDDVRR